MKVFISWSGSLSQRVALALNNWLPTVLQAAHPFLSGEHIPKGSQWFNEIGMHLEEAAYGILCVTPDNQDSPWMLFEAGALAKKVGRGGVCPLLIGMGRSDLNGPLANFQAATADKDEMLKIVKSLNSVNASEAIPEATLEGTFGACWPTLAKTIEEINSAVHWTHGVALGTLRRRNQLPPMAEWAVAREATDILVIGHNLNIILRQSLFFEKKLLDGSHLRLVIVDSADKVLITILSKGVKENVGAASFTRDDFKAPLATILNLRESLLKNGKDPSLIDLRTISYVPTLSFQVLDGRTPTGVIIAELTPNKMEVPARPHFVLSATQTSQPYWYQKFLERVS